MSKCSGPYRPLQYFEQDVGSSYIATMSSLEYLEIIPGDTHKVAEVLPRLYTKRKVSRSGNVAQMMLLSHSPIEPSSQ